MKTKFPYLSWIIFYTLFFATASFAWEENYREAIFCVLGIGMLLFYRSLKNSEQKVVKVRNLSKNPLPEYATPQSAGMDLRANIEESITIEPGQKAFIPTGIYIELPSGFELQVRPRSGLAAKNGVTVLNSPGTVDADYRGEIKVILINHSDQAFTVSNGDRIAQAVVARHESIVWKQVSSLSDTQRGEGGFGHTGKQ